FGAAALGAARRQVVTRRRVSAWRRGVERLQDLLSFADWPARAAAALGLVPPLERREHSFGVRGPIGTARSLRIAFASDLHAGPSTPAALLDRALAVLEAMGADLLLLGGDFVSHRPELVDRVAPRLARIRAPAGTFAVL